MKSEKKFNYTKWSKIKNKLEENYNFLLEG